MEVNVFDQNGKATSKKVTLSDAIFGIEPNDHAIYLDVKQHLANKRQSRNFWFNEKVEKTKRNWWCSCW